MKLAKLRTKLKLVLGLTLLVTALSGCQSESQLPPPSTQSLTQQLLDTKRIVVQGIPASLNKPAEVNFSSRLLTQFNADSSPVASTSTVQPLASPVVVTTYDNVDYEEYFLPEQDSIFLIKFGSEADDLADRYNALLKYTNGLLTAIEQANQVSIIPATKP